MASKELRAWAEKHSIAECLPALVEAGFDTFEVLLQLDEKDLDWMKIQAPGLRKKVLLAVRALSTAENSAENRAVANDNQQQRSETPVVFTFSTPEISSNDAAVSQEAAEGQNQILRLLGRAGGGGRMAGGASNRFSIVPAGNYADLLDDPFFSLLDAVESNNPAGIKAALGTDVEKILELLQQRTEDGKTALHVAVGRGCLKSVETILQGLQIIRKCHNNSDYEREAAESIVSKIINATTAQRGQTSLMIGLALALGGSGASGDSAQGAFDLLLAHGANPNARDSRGRTLAYLTTCIPSTQAISLLSVLKKHGGIDLNARNDPLLDGGEGHSPLLSAVTQGDQKLVSYLLEAGADVNLPSAGDEPVTPLQVAVEDHNNLDLVKVLLQAGAKVSAPEAEFGFSLVDLASALDKKEIAELLLQHEPQLAPVVCD